MQDETGVCRGWIAGQTHVRGGHRAARRRDNDCVVARTAKLKTT